MWVKITHPIGLNLRKPLFAIIFRNWIWQQKSGNILLCIQLYTQSNFQKQFSAYDAKQTSKNNEKTDVKFQMENMQQETTANSCSKVCVCN